MTDLSKRTLRSVFESLSPGDEYTCIRDTPLNTPDGFPPKVGDTVYLFSEMHGDTWVFDLVEIHVPYTYSLRFRRCDLAPWKTASKGAQ